MPTDSRTCRLSVSLQLELATTTVLLEWWLRKVLLAFDMYLCMYVYSLVDLGPNINTGHR